MSTLSVCIAVLVSSDSSSLLAQASAPIERAVFDQADRQKGEATFWVILREKANLASAHGIAQRDARGKFVYDQLTSVAARSQGGLRALLRRRGISFKPFWIANAIQVTGGRALIDELARRPEVERIVADHAVTLEPLPGMDVGQIGTVEWGIDRIRAPQVWSTFGDRGDGIVVANIDTGVKYDHAALVNQYRGNQGGTFNHNYNWFDPSGVCGNPSLVPCDNNGHGTHTMGTMAGDDGNPGTNQIGVAPHVKWIAAKGCELSSCSSAALLAAGQWILAPTDLYGQNPRVDLRPHVVNNSWSTSGSDTFYQATVQAWVASGIFPAFSNGNAGPGCGTVGSPGSYPESYGTAAFDSNNAIADFSSRGPAPANVGGQIKPDIAAPGVNIRSAWNDGGYQSISGTSMASPHLAGTVALMWSAAPSLIGNIAFTRSILDQTAIDTSDLTCGGTAADNNVWGEGRLDAFAAVDQSPRGPTGTLSGTVTDSSAVPIQGATITVNGASNRMTLTGAAGDYMVFLPQGTYTVTASAFAFVAQTTNTSVSDGQTTTLNLTLESASTHTVSGRVTDSFLYPQAGATVTVLGTPLPPATTGLDGSYRLSGVPEGSYQIRAESGRCLVTETQGLTVDGDENLEFSLAVRSDSFGYFCREEPASYIAAGTVLPLTGDDGETQVNLPFPFTFYGQTYNSASVATNGFLNFRAPNVSFSNGAIPSSAEPNAAVYPLWDDLFVDDAASVRTELQGSAPSRRFVIEWRNVFFLGDSAKRLDFEVVLHENGQILFQYQNVAAEGHENGDSATVGIENSDGTVALPYSVNEAALREGLAIRYRLPPQAIVAGTVTDANDGLPIAGAVMKALQGVDVKGQTTTDASGHFQLWLPRGSYAVQAEKINYITSLVPSVSLETEEATVTQNFSLATGRLTVNPASAEFVQVTGTTRTANVALASTGGHGLSWSVSASPVAAWLTIAPNSGSLTVAGSLNVVLTANSSGLKAGVYDTTLAFTSDSGRNPSISVPVRLVVSAYSMAVNAGGAAFTDGGGITWLADRLYTAAAGYGYTAKAASVLTTTAGIAGTTDDVLYQSARVDPAEYRFAVTTAGVYEIDLRFAELQSTGPGGRLFDVFVEGTLVLAGHDIAKEVGILAADRHVFYISVTDGQANIRLAARRGSSKPPVISGLRLTHRPDKH